MQEFLRNSNHSLIICSGFLPPWLTPVPPTSGTGTFGRVFLVKDKKTRTFYALKQMKIPDVIRLKQEQHVHNEKEVLTEVTHPFIIRLWVPTPHTHPPPPHNRDPESCYRSDFAVFRFWLTMHIFTSAQTVIEPISQVFDPSEMVGAETCWVLSTCWLDDFSINLHQQKQREAFCLSEYTHIANWKHICMSTQWL